ncbi:phytanoyl-CoA dioxygenase family protein [Nonomuraea sp. NPDC050310]|uniref:phytanoyl-CoA dioxygenase family protein n=1 Tax=unclassified Nonomuraea TaxID=2593643 RepID=UPI0033CFCF67
MSEATATIDLAAFHEHGYLVVPGLLGPAEVEELREEFTALHAGGPIPGHFTPRPQDESGPYDPLRDYPRVMHPHQVSGVALRYLLDARFGAIVGRLLGEEPVAAQSMFYFKPPGAKGQALHQDNFYLKVEPGTCIAAWVALDVVDRANGGLEVVPGTHLMDLFCPDEADDDRSFTREYVPPPPGLERVPVDMQPGDVLFFNGSLVHGSEPNTTADRFRRSFICHYAGRSTERISAWYPTLTMNGREIHFDEAEGGGPCGTETTAGPH